MEMNLPAQIQQQMENAEKLQADLYGNKETPAPEAANTPEPEVAPEAPAPVAEVEPKVEPVKPEPSDAYEHQYKVLKGKYDAEVPRLYQQLRERDAQLNELSARMEKLEKQPEAPKEDSSEVTGKDVEDFGQDLVDMTRRAARDVFRAESARLLSEIDKRITALDGKVGAVQEKVVVSESEKFWGRVEALVPDWKQVDNDPRWIEFLDSSPEYTTETFREMAGKAIAAGKAEAVAKLVEIWRGPKQEPAKRPDPQAELQRQVAPSTAKSSNVPAGKKAWTGRDYEYAFSPQAEREMKPAELQALQAELTAALAEGRVRW